MKKNLLIATLGTSPAVITEAIDLLSVQGQSPDSICLIKTQDSDINESYQLLLEHIPSKYGINSIFSLDIKRFGDVDSNEAAIEFMQTACYFMKDKRKNYNYYVCIAGGRKAMSALLSLAVQFYGAKRLFHVWAPASIEEKGEIDMLLKYPHKQDEWLHPNLDPSNGDCPRLVDLPFIGLFPLLPRIIAAVQKPASDKEISELLKLNGVLGNDGKVTDFGEKVVDIIKTVETLPPARQQECKIHDFKHHFKEDLKKLSQDLERSFPFITEILGTEWSSGDAKVKSVSPNKLEINIPNGKNVRLGLQLVTTASTSGELEAALKNIEKYVNNKRIKI